MVTNCDLFGFWFVVFFLPKASSAEHFSWQFRLTDLLADGRTGESEADGGPGR